MARYQGSEQLHHCPNCDTWCAEREMRRPVQGIETTLEFRCPKCSSLLIIDCLDPAASRKRYIIEHPIPPHMECEDMWEFELVETA